MELFALFISLFIIQVNGQSNIDLQGNAIEYQGEGLPEQTILDGKVTKLDELSPVIFLNRTKALLNCAEGLMQIELKFDEPYYGIAYADFNRNSPCQIIGKGELTYSLDLPLKGCGTYQDPLRVFTNNIVVRFHPSLEIDGDETITVVCRYPSPIVPPPPGLSRYIKNDEPPQSILSAPLNGTQILLIMCAVLFLTLVLFGLAGSYYCIRHRRVAIVHRSPYSLGSSSEITKLSGSSRGSNGFEELKIPQLHTQLTASHSSSGSEGALIPSDYPSETFSEIEDVENRSIQISSGGSYENKAYIQETDNFYSEKSFSQNIHPKVKVRKPTVLTTEEISTMKLEKNLTSILEERPIRKTQTTEEEHYEWNEETVDQTTSIFKPIQREKTTTEEFNESMYTEENTMMKTGSKTPPTPITPNRNNQKTSKMTTTTEELTEETLEEYEMRKRMMRLHNNDNEKWNVRMRKISIDENHDSRLEWENFSDISSVSNMTMTPKFERARFSVASVNDLSNERKEPLFSPDLVGTIDHRTPHSLSAHYSRETSTSKSYISQYNIPLENTHIINWEVLIRVFQPEKYAEANIDSETLTVSDKMAWKKIIMNESSLRNDLIRACAPEDFVRISCDRRYKNLFEPHKWDVLIRLLSVPSFNGSNFDNFSLSNSSRKSNSASSSRKNSLPTLYEHETDRKTGTTKKESSKMSTKSSYKSDTADMRSMSEMTVEFDRIDCETNGYDFDREFERDEHQQTGSSNKMYTMRSSSPNSLVRSASEFTEFWVPPQQQQQQDTEVSSIYSTQIHKMHDSNKNSKHVSKENRFFTKQQSNSNWFDDNESDSSYRF